MFKHILVPLDGSKLAEAALPAAVSLAKTFKAPVTLLHIIEQDAPEEIHRDRHLTEASEAEAYLAKIAKRIFPKASRSTCMSILLRSRMWRAASLTIPRMRSNLT